MKISNSKESAVMSGKWVKPGSDFYNRLLNEDNYHALINEAFLISGEISKDTTYSQSGCKYPHHTIKNGELVVSAPGVKAAYSRAKQMGIYKGDVKAHLDKHMRELEFLNKDGVHYEGVMEENFRYIESVIDSALGTKLVMMESGLQEYDEKSHGRLKYEFRFVIGEQNGHLYKIVYKLNPANVTSDNLAKGDYLDKLQKNITRTGHGNYTSMGNTVIGIKDMCNGQRVNSVSAYPPIHNSGGSIMPVNKSKWMKQMSSFVKRGFFQQAKMDEYIAKYEKECPTGIWPAVGWEESIDDSKNNGQKPIVYTVGKVDNTDTYKTTKITNVLDGMLGLKTESSIANESTEEASIEELEEWIESFVNDKDFRESVEVFEEAKLRFDYRLAYNIKTGHLLKIVYELYKINMTYAGHAYGHDQYDDKGNLISPKEDIDDALKHIKSQGNIDHISKGQMVVGITDIPLSKSSKASDRFNSRLTEADVLSPISSLDNPDDNSYNRESIPMDEVKRRMMNGYKPTHIKVGAIDQTYTFKSTALFKNMTAGMYAQTLFKSMRGAKIKKFTGNEGNAIQILIKVATDESEQYLLDFISHWNSKSFPTDNPINKLANTTKITKDIINKAILASNDEKVKTKLKSVIGKINV